MSHRQISGRLCPFRNHITETLERFIEMREQKQMYDFEPVESVSAVLLLPTTHSLRLVSAPMGSCPKFLDLEQTNEQSAKTQKQNVAKQNEPITMQTT